MIEKTVTTISHAQARVSAKRFIDEHFNNPHRQLPQISIPVRETDDDILLMDYIKQQEGKDAK